MNKRPEDPNSRRAALARLLAEALRAQPASGGGPANVSACPDAELLAAYAERGLAEEETAHWESHFADCERCQMIIAALAVSDEELTPAEVQKLGSLAVVAPLAHESAGRNAPAASETAPAQILIRPRPTPWRWLLPAMGLAAAVALWFALRPAPPNPVLTAQRNVATEAPREVVAPSAPVVSSAKPAETPAPQANLPSPPSPEPPAVALLRESRPAAPNSPVPAPESAPKQEAFQSAARTPSASAPAPAPAAPAPEAAARNDQVLSAQAAPAQRSEARDAGAPAAAGSLSAPVPAPAPQGALGGSAGFGARAPISALAKTEPPPVVFASPARGSLWRLGTAGRIERSTDGGRTWLLQSSGVTSELLAGAAPSDNVAWAVGRAGAILRTTDGERWQRVTPPARATSDFVAVETRDALHATITSRDLRRFATEDGGRTWVPQQ